MRSFIEARGLIVRMLGILLVLFSAAEVLGAEDLVLAARNGDVDEVEAILQEGRSADAVDDQGETALGWATFNGHTDVVKALLKAGVDV